MQKHKSGDEATKRCHLVNGAAVKRCQWNNDVAVNRCQWVNLKNHLYIDYHDNEWGKPSHDEHYLYEMFILETFQAGLSWECILNKCEAFEKAFDDFNLDKVCSYGENDVTRLMKDPRNNSKQT